jgi:hypothetical protein
VWGIFIFGWLLWVSLDIHSFKRQIQDSVCHKSRRVYLEGDAFWSEEWTSNISKSYDKKIQIIYQNFHEDIPRWFYNLQWHGDSFAKVQIMLLEVQGIQHQFKLGETCTFKIIFGIIIGLIVS